MKKNKKKRAGNIEIKSSFNGGALTNCSCIKANCGFIGKLNLIKCLNSLSIASIINITSENTNGHRQIGNQDCSAMGQLELLQNRPNSYIFYFSTTASILLIKSSLI